MLPTSPADEAGLDVADVIVEVDGVGVGEDFDDLVAGFEIGSTHEIVFVRGRRLFSTTLVVAER